MRLQRSIYIKLFIAVLILQGCREVYYPEIDKYENILVVDGLITDREGPHTVKLSRSFAFDETFPDPESGAVVVLFDEEANEYLFSEVQPGIYRSDASLKGKVGSSYMLFVSTADEEEYESEWVELRGVPEIDSITYRYDERESTDPNEPIRGVQVKINTHDPQDQTRYYRWEWSETWEILTPIRSSIYPDENRCWKSASSSSIAIGTSEHLTKDILVDYPLYFVSADNNKLKIKYSSEIYQYSLSREAYSYWKNLQDITQNTGSLFDPTPAMVVGNIHNLNNQGSPVLGIFQASAVSTERIIIDRTEIPAFLDIPNGYASCNFFTTSDSAEMAYFDNHNFPFVDAYYDRNILYHIYTNSVMCFRCTFSGSNEKPDYWP